MFPREYFHPCFDAAPFSSRLEGVTYQNGQWRLAVSGPNGNTALVTLNEKLERTAVEFSVPVPVVKLVSVLRSGTWPIIRNGQPVEIEYREIVVQHPAFCQDSRWQDFRSPPPGNSPPTLIRTTFRLLFDPATQLSWAQTLGEPPPTFVETADQITAFSLADSQLMVRPSASRYDNWGQFEHDLFESIWSNGSGPWGGNPFNIDLKANLSELGQSRPQALKAKATADGWLVTITAPDGQSTDVELTHQFRLKGTGDSR